MIAKIFFVKTALILALFLLKVHTIPEVTIPEVIYEGHDQTKSFTTRWDPVWLSDLNKQLDILSFMFSGLLLP